MAGMVKGRIRWGEWARRRSLPVDGGASPVV
jgi:hypothetical protein